MYIKMTKCIVIKLLFIELMELWTIFFLFSKLYIK